MVRACSTRGHWEIRIIFWPKTRREKITPKTRRRREDNIRMDLRERGWEGVDWLCLTQDSDQWWALVNTVMNLRFPVGNFLTN
jgi:hypothetical protein